MISSLRLLLVFCLGVVDPINGFVPKSLATATFRELYPSRRNSVIRTVVQHGQASIPLEVTIKNPRYDKTFKSVFGEDTGRTVSFLNSVLALQDPIVEASFIEPLQTEHGDRKIRLDVIVRAKCASGIGIIFDIELQKGHEPAFEKRWVYYLARELSSESEKMNTAISTMSDDNEKKRARESFYKDISLIQSVIIMDFDGANHLMNTDDIVVNWSIAESKSHKVASHLLSWSFISLPRFETSLSTRGAGLDFTGDPASAWLYLLTRNADTKILLTPELTANDESIWGAYCHLSSLKDIDTEELDVDTQLKS